MIDSNPTACTCPSGDGSLRHPCQVHNANCVGDAAPFDLVAHLERQRYFSAHTFGPGTRAAGIVDHIRKELLEIEADPGDLREWVDVIILAFDGAWRSGATAQEIISAIVVKQTKNEGRTWPHWSTMPADKAIEHDRSGDMPRCTPTAPGIDLRKLTDSWLEQAERVSAKSPDKAAGLWACAKELRDLIDAAPVAAAPVDLSNWAGHYSINPAAVEALQSMLACTPAAPGIDPADPWRGLYSQELMPKLDGVNDWIAAHPDLPQWPDDEERGIDNLIKAQGFAYAVVGDEYPDEDEAVQLDPCAWLANWKPEPPAGEHWRLVMIQDTEDGPAAVYVRPLALIDGSPKGGIHPDDAAVDAFAAEMKAKLAKAREKGRGGWQGDEPGMQQRLSDMLREHVEKGDPRDVANFCMFLHQRGEGISPKGGSDAPTDTDRLNFIADGLLRIKPVDIRASEDDADVGWVISEHHMGRGMVELIRWYNDNLRSAIDAAMQATSAEVGA